MFLRELQLLSTFLSLAQPVAHHHPHIYVHLHHHVTIVHLENRIIVVGYFSPEFYPAPISSEAELYFDNKTPPVLNLKRSRMGEM